MDKRCPRHLNRLPTESCSEGRRAIDLARQGKVGGCPWFVVDAQSHFCFFKYMADNGDLMTNPHRIAHLLLIEDRKIKEVVLQFRHRIAALFKATKPKDLFGWE